MSLRQAAVGLLRGLRSSPQTVTANCFGRTTREMIQTGKMELYCEDGFGGYSWRRQYRLSYMWIFLTGQAVILGIYSGPVLAEGVSSAVSPENNMQEANLTGLRKVEDGAVISNSHTSKWRIFTDNGRNLFLQGKLEEAETFFLSALQEAKEGFGERDPHVASAYNNLAELYRIKKAFHKAEPLYLEAVKILEESYGPEDIRVGAALHNLGQFYLVQRKLEEACICYERALKIKRRVLGHGHTDYADTMYHLGTVLYLLQKEKDAETLIHNSIKILEEGGLGESIICLRRLRYLAKIYIKSNRLAEAVNIQRKILHNMELSKGWNSLDTLTVAEGLGLTLQSVGNLMEAKDLLERCLEGRKAILPEEHIQVAANMLYIARVEMLNSHQLRETNSSEAISALDKSKVHLDNCIRIAQRILYKSAKEEDKQRYGLSRETIKDEHAALVILLQSLNALGLLEIAKQELLETRGDHSSVVGAENTLRECIYAFKEFGTKRAMYSSPDIKAEYLSCLKHLSSLISNSKADGMQQQRRASLQELKDEIKRVDGDLSPHGKPEK